MLRQGSGPPLLLFHGVMGSEAMWRDVVPLLAPDFDVIAPSALGHRGGPPATLRPARIGHVIDAAEQLLDQLSIEKAHLVGNSMGGWMALELARRGRALSVCALSPAGLWPQDGLSMARRTHHLRADLRLGRLLRPVLPLGYHLQPIRTFALRHVSAAGGRIPPAQALELTDDMLAATVADDLLASNDEAFALMDPLPCPVAVYWSERDRIFPEPEYRSQVRERLPGASYEVLEGLGHVPMLDSVETVVRCIRAATSLALNT